MATVIVNDVEVEIGPKDNVILAARRAGVEIPHYCWHPDLTVVASCRMCLVEVGEKKPDGSIVMGPKVVPACQTPAKDGLVIKTDTPRVKQAQGQTLEFLLLNHPLDCPICDQAGECYLQDYTFKFGKAHSRLNEPKVQRIDKYHIGDEIALFTDRCVMCTRCVRFTREVSGTAELQVISRGSVEEIDVFPGKPCNNKLAGNVVDICPVGALCSKDFLYKKRVWWLKSQDSVCASCSTGCSIRVDQDENVVQRLKPRENPLAQGNFMCDEGRFGFKYIHDPSRLTVPAINAKGATVASMGTNGHASKGVDAATDLTFIDPWPAILQLVRGEIDRAAANDPEKFVIVLSPFMTCEEAYLLASYAKKKSPKIRLALGPVPVVGEDDRYPKDAHGNNPPLEKTRFTIRAEKCPNRIGVEEVIKHYEGKVTSFADVLFAAKRGEFKGAYLVGGYPSAWISDEDASAFSEMETVIVQDILPSPLTAIAKFVLAGGSFAEREGTFVNHGGLAQAIRPAVRPPGEARPDGRILMELAGRTGLFHAASLRIEMAENVPFFRNLRDGELGEWGCKLVEDAQPAPTV